MNNDYQLVWDSDVLKEHWDDLLKGSNLASYFQSPAGYQVLKGFSEWTVHAMGLKFKGVLVASLVFVIQKEKGIKGFFSERCIIFSGPIFKDQSALKILLEALDRKVAGCIYIEIRNGYLTKDDQNVFIDLKWRYKKWLNFIVDTTESSSILKNMSESRRRQLKKSEKKGVQFHNPVLLEDVKDFYTILQSLYLTKVRKPLPAWELFQLFFDSDPRNFVLVYYENKVIGGILCPFLMGTGLYEFYVAGLDEEYKDCYPSAMATYGAMVQAFELGIPKFDFMGGGNPEEGYGVREFKSRFGGEQVEWGRWLKVKKPVLFWLGSKYIKWRSE